MRIEHAPLVPGLVLRLRAIEAGDIEAWYAYLRLPHVVEHTSWSLASAEDLRPIVAWYEAADADSAIRFAVMEGDALIGTIGFHTISTRNCTAEIAYDFHPDWWGRGIATVCCRAVADWGVATRGFVRVQATTLDTNLKSVAVLERSGFAAEGLLRNYRMVRGVPRNFRLFSKVGQWSTMP